MANKKGGMTLDDESWEKRLAELRKQASAKKKVKKTTKKKK